MGSTWGELAIVLALVLANGVFAGAEIALLSLRKSRVQELSDNGVRAARVVQRLRDNPERLLATVQIGITVVGATAAAFGGSTLASRLAPRLEAWGVSPNVAEDVAFAGVVGGVSYLTLVLGELVPKSLALRYAERYALWLARPLWGLSLLAQPVVWFLTQSSNVVLRFFNDRTTFSEARLSPDELQQLVEEATKAGSLDPRSGEIASRAFDLRQLTAEDVMIPRQRVVALSRSASQEEIRRTLLEDGRSRMPVYEGSLDRIVGYVTARDLLSMAFERELVVLEDLLRAPYFVPGTARAVEVLSELQRRRKKLAIVVNEHGGVQGILTAEDLLEELVGDIHGEDDSDGEPLSREGESLVVPGAYPVRELNRALGVELEEGEEYSSVGGWVTFQEGSIPQAGARFTAADGTVLEVLDASARRVRWVKVTPKWAAGPRGTSSVTPQSE